MRAEVAALVYHNLRVLMEETDVDAFEELLEKTIEQLNTSSETEEFAMYFTKMYASRKGQHAIGKSLESIPTCM